MWDAFNQPTFLFLKKTKRLKSPPAEFWNPIPPLHLFLNKIVITEKKSKSKNNQIEFQDQLWKNTDSLELALFLFWLDTSNFLIFWPVSL